MLRSHRRQFVIGPAILNCSASWQARELGPGLWLSFDEALPVLQAESNWLLGYAVNALEGRPVSVDELKQLTVPTFSTQTAAWCGRWLVVIDGVAMGDIGALLGLFYPTTGRSEVWCGSSGPLVARQLGLNPQKGPSTIAPSSRFEGLSLLLPGQAIDLRAGRTRLVDAKPFPPVPGDEQDLLKLCLTLIGGAIEGFAKLSEGSLFIGLSGGADSRRNAAVARHRGITAKTFTFQKPWWSTTDADRELPDAVARRLGYELTTVKTGVVDPQLHELWVEHTGDPTPNDRPGSNHYYFTRGYWASLGYHQTVVEGQCYELASNYYYEHHWKLTPSFCVQDLHEAITRATPAAFERTEAYWASLDLEGLRIDRRDLLFWSYAIQSAYSNCYQEEDLWVDALCPSNCRLLYAAMLSVSPEGREGKAFQNRVTAAAAPALDGLPINFPDRFAHRYLVYALAIRRMGLRVSAYKLAKKLRRRVFGS